MVKKGEVKTAAQAVNRRPELEPGLRLINQAISGSSTSPTGPELVTTRATGSGSVILSRYGDAIKVGNA
jgi:hypothetical protein